ncbi:metal ABC transporter permease [Microbacterium sp. YY-01]|uniref:metal ABC transporter permease n=1 Tax=Microbacterium sp. YY-01 TaxID=3421634 RepID=UPI003D1842CD
MRRALITALVVGMVCGTVGTLTLLRGASLIGDAVSHAVLPGIAASSAIGLGFFPGALVAGLLTAVGISFLSSHSKVRNDALIGVVFTAMFSLGVIMISLRPASTDLTKILFGNVMAVNQSDMLVTLVVAALVTLVIVLLFTRFLISTFDPAVGATYGISPNAMHYVLMTLLTVVTVASLQAVGVILVVALLITPAATAFLVARSLAGMMLWSGSLGAAASVVGLIASFYLNVPSGPAIAIAATLLFLAVLAVTKLVSRRRIRVITPQRKQQ